MVTRKTKKMASYAAIFTPAKEGGYVVNVPALPGCFSEGNTFEEAKKNIAEAIKLYREVMEGSVSLHQDEFVVSPVHVPV